MIKRSFFIFSLLLIVGLSYLSAQSKGTIRGVVIEDATGEPLIGVTVFVEGTSQGAITDFDGNFNISITPGNYNLKISFVSFETITITDVIVEENQITYFENIRLRESIAELEAVVVTAEVIRNSEAALLSVKRKSANLMDGISAASFKKIGDSDASKAIKRVTGVSVEGGKYVFVRGLGDRYTKTILNGMEIPGLDPDMNSLQIDIFPTNLLNNLIVLKTATADLPADFTGGLVNIETKDFPEEKIFEISAGIGFNPAMHFQNDFLAASGGTTDFLGFDDGTRALPEEARGEQIPNPVGGDYSPEDVNNFVRSFDSSLGPVIETSPMNYSLSLSAGNQKQLQNGHTLGYIFSATYKSNTQFFDDVAFAEYQRDGSADNYDLVYAYIQSGLLTNQSVLLGGLGGLAYKTNNSKYKLSVLHLQNGERRAAKFFIDDNGTAVGKSGYTADSYNLDYNQRGLTNILLNGEHYFDDAKWKLEWKIAPTLSRLSDPDVRKTAFTLNTGSPTFEAGNGGNPSRIWRELEEINYSARADVTKEGSWFQRDSKIKLGVGYLYKERDYEILFFDLQRFGAAPVLSGDPNEVLTDSNIYPEGVYYYQTGNNIPNSNQYNSKASNLSAYISTEFNPLANLKLIAGLRMEDFTQRHTGRDQEFSRSGVGNNLDNEKVLDALDFFPSLNAILSTSENQNIRFSFSRTIARPSFKELSFAQILDPITNRTFNGGLFPFIDGDGNTIWDGRLTETRINNLDLRWELFMSRAQLLSVSAFYKTFDRPIELVRIPAAQTGLEFQPRNVGDGTVLGVELEARKSLDFISNSLEKLSISGNLTIVHSEIEMSSTEFDARKIFEKTGETISDTRAMAGQAPYIINAGLSYVDQQIGFDAGIFYNVNGPTLTIVGGGLTPDVFSEPFHSLNFNMNKSFGKERRFSVNLGVDNILNDLREEFYTGFRAEEQVFTRFNPGTTFNLGIKYDVF